MDCRAQALATGDNFELTNHTRSFKMTNPSYAKTNQLLAALPDLEFKRGGALQSVLLRYIEALFVQAAQTAACNRHHTLDKRLCRWLLLTLDRTNSIELHMTQQRIAYMLGVRREAVVVAARKLQL